MLLDMYRNREIPNLKMCLKTRNETDNNSELLFALCSNRESSDFEIL